MWTLSAFGDEIAEDLSEQNRVLEAESIRYLDLRAAWGRNVLDLTDDDLATIRRELGARGMRVATIGSPIGKLPVTDPFAPHLARFRRALEVAQALEAPVIRIFSFYVPEGEDPARHRDEVLARLSALVDAARDSGVTLLHENEKGIYGDVPSRCLDLLATVDDPLLRAIWDPANFVQCGVRPHDEGYAALRPYLAAVHVKDAVRATGEVVPAGQGDGQLAETLRALRDSGFDGVFALEPHLLHGGAFGGFSGPARFHEAAAALRGLLDELGVTYR
ncbi:MAG TPA: sugar phosphate isomerase/epimerase [Thermomicrobiaceae bacterium]|nr:sugar phosphate isomerase/epimerase [Thermomicrobiaceae bacterium]